MTSAILYFTDKKNPGLVLFFFIYIFYYEKIACSNNSYNTSNDFLNNWNPLLIDPEWKSCGSETEMRDERFLARDVTRDKTKVKSVQHLMES